MSDRQTERGEVMKVDALTQANALQAEAQALQVQAEAMFARAREMQDQVAEMRMDGLPPGTPLFATTARAVELFGISKRALSDLRSKHEDFPARQQVDGGNVLYDVPRCYAWFARHLGTDCADAKRPAPRIKRRGT